MPSTHNCRLSRTKARAILRAGQRDQPGEPGVDGRMARTLGACIGDQTPGGFCVTSGGHGRRLSAADIARRRSGYRRGHWLATPSASDSRRWATGSGGHWPGMCWARGAKMRVFDLGQAWAGFGVIPSSQSSSRSPTRPPGGARPRSRRIGAMGSRSRACHARVASGRGSRRRCGWAGRLRRGAGTGRPRHVDQLQEIAAGARATPPVRSRTIRPAPDTVTGPIRSAATSAWRKGRKMTRHAEPPYRHALSAWLRSEMQSAAPARIGKMVLVPRPRDPPGVRVTRLCGRGCRAGEPDRTPPVEPIFGHVAHRAPASVRPVPGIGRAARGLLRPWPSSSRLTAASGPAPWIRPTAAFAGVRPPERGAAKILHADRGPDADRNPRFAPKASICCAATCR